MPTQRASRMPLTLLCPASQGVEAVTISGDDYPARLGTAAHEVTTSAIAGREVSIIDIAARNRVDQDELDVLASQTWRAWEEVRRYFPNPEVETPLSNIDGDTELTGTADVMSFMPHPEIRILDLKTGRRERDHWDQLRAYGLMAAHANQADTVYVAVLRVRNRSIEGRWYTREELYDWWTEAKAAMGSGDYRPGYEQCRDCHRGPNCPAKTALLRQAFEAFTTGDGAFWPDNATSLALETHGSRMADLLRTLRLLRRTIDDTDELIRAEVARLGGTVPVGSGEELRLTEQTQKHIKPLEAWDILTEALPTPSVLQAVRVSKSALADIIGEYVPKGGKAKAVRELWRRLEEAGAMEEKIIDRLEIRSVDQRPAEPAGSLEGVLALADPQSQGKGE